MQKRGFLILLGVTVLAVAGAVYAVAGAPRAAKPLASDTKVFPDLAGSLGDLAWVRLSHGAVKTDFALVGKRWELVEKGNYPAAAGRIRQLLIGLAGLTLVEPKTDRPDLFARLELDDPANGHSTLVTLQDRQGKTVAELIVGKTRHDRLGTGSDAVYVRRPGEQRTWLARGSLDMPADTADWLDRRIIDLPPARVTSVALTDSDGAVMTLQRDPSNGKFAVAEPPPDAKFKSDAILAAPAGALATLDLGDVKPSVDLPAATGVSIAKFTTVDGLSVELQLFSRDNADWMTIEASGSGAAEAEAKTINDKVGRWAFAIPPERAKLLRTKLADLVEPQKGS